MFLLFIFLSLGEIGRVCVSMGLGDQLKRLRLNLTAMHGAVNTPRAREQRVYGRVQRENLSECSDEGPTLETL